METCGTPVLLAEEFGKLVDNRDLMWSRVEKAKAKNDIINGAVWEWLDEVDKLIQEMNEKKKKGVVGVIVPVDEDENYFNSMKDASEKLWMALQDDEYNIIGFSGKRGAGKTTLVKSEMKKYEKIFSRVIFLNMFRKDLKSMYEEFANSLNVHFKSDDYDLEKVFRSGEVKIGNKVKAEIDKVGVTTLIILDNFSTQYYLENLDIPYRSTQCKVLLIIDDEADCTLHHKYIKLQKQACDYSVLLRPISNDEAWELLQKLTGIDSNSAELFNLAREVAFRCKGLPALINNVVPFLDNKNTVEYWTETLDNLGHFRVSNRIYVSSHEDNFSLALSDALVKEGFNVFIPDNDESSLKDVEEEIEQSSCSIIVLSKDYAANSSSHLFELVKILTLKEENKQPVFPIFYKVKPSDLGCHGEKQWTSAINEVASLPDGKQYISGSKENFIKEIVEYVNNNKHRLHIQHPYGPQQGFCSYGDWCARN